MAAHPWPCLSCRSLSSIWRRSSSTATTKAGFCPSPSPSPYAANPCYVLLIFTCHSVLLQDSIYVVIAICLLDDIEVDVCKRLFVAILIVNNDVVVLSLESLAGTKVLDCIFLLNLLG